jgi:hypothetical protein
MPSEALSLDGDLRYVVVSRGDLNGILYNYLPVVARWGSLEIRSMGSGLGSGGTRGVGTAEPINSVGGPETCSSINVGSTLTFCLTAPWTTSCHRP